MSCFFFLFHVFFFKQRFSVGIDASTPIHPAEKPAFPDDGNEWSWVKGKKKTLPVARIEPGSLALRSRRLSDCSKRMQSSRYQFVLCTPQTRTLGLRSAHLRVAVGILEKRCVYHQSSAFPQPGIGQPKRIHPEKASRSTVVVVRQMDAWFFPRGLIPSVC